MKKIIAEASVNQSLASFYENLPKPIAPKTKFIIDISLKCKVTETTVRNWVKGKVKPNNPEHIRILAQATGLTADSLFAA